MWADPCELCGNDRRGEVQPSLARFADGEYRAVRRCRDTDACRQRVEAAGQPWPMADDVEVAG